MANALEHNISFFSHKMALANQKAGALEMLLPRQSWDRIRTLHALCFMRDWVYNMLIVMYVVTPRFPVRPDWRIRTGFRARDYILGLFTCFFFFYNIIKISYTTYKRTTTGVVFIKIYTHILSPIYIYKNCTFTFTN